MEKHVRDEIPSQSSESMESLLECFISIYTLYML